MYGVAGETEPPPVEKTPHQDGTDLAPPGQGRGKVGWSQRAWGQRTVETWVVLEEIYR